MIGQKIRALVMACVAMVFGIFAQTSQAGVVSYMWNGMFGPPGSLAYYRAARVNARQGIYPQSFAYTFGRGPYAAAYAPMGMGATGFSSYSAGYAPMPMSVGFSPVDMGTTSGFADACCNPCQCCAGGSSSGNSCPGGNCGQAQTYEAGRYPERAIPDPNASGTGTNSNNNNNGGNSNNNNYNQPVGPQPDDGFVPPRQNPSGVNQDGGDAPNYQPPKNNEPAPPFSFEPSADQNFEIPKLQPIGPVASLSWDTKVQPMRLTREARFVLPAMVRHVEPVRVLVPAPAAIQIAGK